MNRRLPPNLLQRQYRTAGGYKRTLFYVRFVDWKGKRRSIAVGDNFSHAAAERSRLMQLNRERFDFDAKHRQKPTLFAWVEKYLAAKGQNVHTLERYRFATDRLKAGLGDIELESITHGTLLEYRAARRKQVKDSTINREFLSLRSILRMAFHEGALEKVPRIPFEQEHNERTRTATAAEIKAIFQALDKDRRQASEIILEMGFRLAEVLEITPADLGPDCQSIDMTRIRKKRGLRYELPLSQRARAILMERSRDKDEDEKLFNFTRHQWHSTFARACKELGIRGLWLYDLKATFATAKQREGWPDKIVMAFTGHKSAYAFRRYSRPTADDLRQFIRSPRLRNGNKAKRATENSRASD